MKRKDEKYLKALGNHVRLLLEERGLSPETVAARGEIETKQVYRVINAEVNATVSTMKAIAKGLDVHIKVLFEF